MNDRTEFDAGYAAVQIHRRESALRARVKQHYLDRILRYVRGATVDIGCGAGQLLEQLPPGSTGIEVNPSLVADLKARGMQVEEVQPRPDRIGLGGLQPGSHQTAVLSHVLEHFDDAATVLRCLLDDCQALGIGRVVLVIPGARGYRSDATHTTFVTVDYLRRHGFFDEAGLSCVHRSYFPIDAQFLGRWFVYHELMVVFDIAPTRAAR